MKKRASIDWEMLIYEPTSGDDPIRCYGELPQSEYGFGYNGPGYYFWTKDWKELRGPFSSLPLCQKALEKYRDPECIPEQSTAVLN